MRAPHLSRARKRRSRSYDEEATELRRIRPSASPIKTVWNALTDPVDADARDLQDGSISPVVAAKTLKHYNNCTELVTSQPETTTTLGLISEATTELVSSQSETTSALGLDSQVSTQLATSQAEAASPLGILSVLPQELRDMVYEYTQEVQAIGITAKCRPHSVLALASRTLHTEVMFVFDRPQGWPCEHTHFTYDSSMPIWDCRTLRHADEPILRSAIRSRLATHPNLANMRQLRITCSDHSRDYFSIPSASIIFKLPTAPGLPLTCELESTIYNPDPNTGTRYHLDVTPLSVDFDREFRQLTNDADRWPALVKSIEKVENRIQWFRAGRYKEIFWAKVLTRVVSGLIATCLVFLAMGVQWRVRGD